MRLTPFIMLSATGFFAIFSSTASKSPVLPLYAVHLGASPMEVGVVAAVSTLAGILFSIPAGVLSDRWGRKTMLLVSGLIFASAPLLYLVAASIFQLGVVRFYHGLATAIFVPVAMAYVSELHETSKGEKLGWFSRRLCVDASWHLLLAEESWLLRLQARSLPLEGFTSFVLWPG